MIKINTRRNYAKASQKLSRMFFSDEDFFIPFCVVGSVFSNVLWSRRMQNTKWMGTHPQTSSPSPSLCNLSKRTFKLLTRAFHHHTTTSHRNGIESSKTRSNSSIAWFLKWFSSFILRSSLVKRVKREGKRFYVRVLQVISDGIKRKFNSLLKASDANEICKKIFLFAVVRVSERFNCEKHFFLLFAFLST